MSEKYPDWYELPRERWRDHPNYGHRDSQRQKLYYAEGTTKAFMGELNTQFSSIEEIQKFTDKLLSSAWIKKRFKLKNLTEIHVLLLKRGHTAYAQYNEIHLPKWAWNKIVVIHEISHILHKHSLCIGTSHGRLFARILLELVGHILGSKARKILKEAYKSEHVKYTPKRQITEEDRQARRERFIQNVLKTESDFNCVDCGKNTLRNKEYFMLKNELWKSICRLDDKKILCLNCIEIRLGRPLVKSDFAICEITLDNSKKCPELAKRFNRN